MFDGSIRNSVHKSDRAGWILVGGRSTRMGKDKAFLEIDGRPLALRVADAVTRLCGVAKLIGDPEKYSALGLPVIPDEFPGEGPLAGIEAALRCTTADWNLVVACDMPTLDAGLMESLFDTDGDCVIPRYEDGRLEPLCAVYHRCCHQAIRNALEAGVRKVTDALGEPLAVRYLQVGSSDPFANLNTPEDLRRYTDG